MFHSTTIAPAAVPFSFALAIARSGTHKNAPTRASSGEDDVGDLHDALIALVPNTHHNPRVVLVLERATAAHDDAPRLADNLRPSRNRERVGDIVRAGVDKDEPAARIRVEHPLERSGVVRRAVAHGALVAHAHDLVDGDVRVLRVRLAEDAARAVEQAARLGRRGDVRLREARGLRRARVDVALAPARDRHRSPIEDVRAAGRGHRRGHAREVDVVQDERAGEPARGSGGGADEDGRVRDPGVDNGNRSDGLCSAVFGSVEGWKHVGTVAEAQESDLGVLRDATSHEVKANLAVVDCTEYKVSKEPWTCAIERVYAYQ